jgi:hypothetical protein
MNITGCLDQEHNANRQATKQINSPAQKVKSLAKEKKDLLLARVASFPTLNIACSKYSLLNIMTFTIALRQTGLQVVRVKMLVDGKRFFANTKWTRGLQSRVLGFKVWLFVLARLLPVDPDLRNDGQINGDLQGAADEELGRRVPEVEVGRFEGVAAQPHAHHLDAETDRKKEEWVDRAV